MDSRPCFIYLKRNLREPWKSEWGISLNKPFKAPYVSFDNGLTIGFYNDVTERFSPFDYSREAWSYILNRTISCHLNKDKFYFSSLYLFVTHAKCKSFISESFSKALIDITIKYPHLKDWIVNEVYKCATLASFNKQELIIPILNALGYTYKIIKSPTIIEAYHEVSGFEKKDYNSFIMFGHFSYLIDAVTKIIAQNHPAIPEIKESKNELIKMILWIISDAKTPHIETIDKYFYYFHLKIRVQIIQKLFYEHVRGNIRLDINTLNLLINSSRKVLYTYQISISNKQNNIIFMELLLDSLKCYTQTQSFLSLNSVLDIAIQNSSIDEQYIDLAPTLLFKCCDGGFRISSRFIGFAEQSINGDFMQFKINERVFTGDYKEYMLNNTITILNQYAQYDKDQNTWNIPIQNKKERDQLTKMLHIRTQGSPKTSTSYLVDYKDINIDMSKKKNIERDPVGYKEICHPVLASSKNLFLDKDFLWCSGSPCFRSSITFRKEQQWKGYKLIDYINILGHDVTLQTNCGLVGNEAYNKFVDTILKAKRILDKLKCNECKHILFPSRKTNNIYANDYTYFCCENELCTEYKKEIYLTHCHDCRSGLIDSRETAKCPNGIYICPACLACCSNSYFDRISQKYILANRPTPTRLNTLLGNGHKDKGITYCPQCGSQLSDTTECTNCHYQTPNLYRYRNSK